MSNDNEIYPLPEYKTMSAMARAHTGDDERRSLNQNTKNEARVRELEKAIRSMVYWHKPDGVWRVGIIGDCQAPDEVQHALANSEKEN